MTTTIFDPQVINAQPLPDPRAPMSSAPMVYNADHSVAWERMWGAFCVLASAGGPPHRAVMLEPETSADPQSEAYQGAVAEIIRGVRLVSGLPAKPAATGWIAITCPHVSMARWLSEQIGQENVASQWEGRRVLVPVGASYTLKGEIKNVITAVAKTTHYWQDHVAVEVKQSLAWEARLSAFKARLRQWRRA